MVWRYRNYSLLKTINFWSIEDILSQNLHYSFFFFFLVCVVKYNFMKKIVLLFVLASAVSFVVSCSKVEDSVPSMENNSTSHSGLTQTSSSPMEESKIPGTSSLRCTACPIEILGPDEVPYGGAIKICGQTNSQVCYVVRDVADDGSLMEVDLYESDGINIASTITGTLSSYTNANLMSIQGQDYLYIINNGAITPIYSGD